MSDISLLNDLTKPATVLIEKIADATGVLYEPRRIKKNAKAEAEAMIIRAKAEIEIDDLKKRALTRFVEEEVKKQENIENIIDKTLPLLKENSENRKIEEDWIANFFDKCRLVSDEDMQLLWAKILAGEFNKPETFSLRTLEIVKNITKKEAEEFTAFARAVVKINGNYGILITEPFHIYLSDKFHISQRTISILKDVGLLQPAGAHLILDAKNDNSLNHRLNIGRGLLLMGVKPLEFDIGSKKYGFLEIFSEMLTNAGRELLTLTKAEDNDRGLMEDMKRLFSEIAQTTEVITEEREGSTIIVW